MGAPASIGAGGRSSKPTDSDGFFSIEAAPSVTIGTPITVQIQKDGFQTFTRQMDYTGVSQVITLEDDNPTVKPGTVKPTNKPRVQTQPPVAGAAGPAQPPAPLRSPTGDVIIDSVQERLNSLRSDATDAQTTSILRGLFDAPIFGSIGEELSEDALYRFCRTERILMHYQLRFGAPEVRTAASTGSPNLIYLQDIFADLYGPTFSAKEHCNRFGARPLSEYQSNLAQRLKDRNSLDGVRAQRVIDMMLNTLYAVGLASHAPPIPPPVTTPPPPQGQGGTNTNPPANTAKVQIDPARLNKWLDQGNKGDGQYWLKSIVLRIDTDERQIAKNLAFTSEVPQVDQSFTLTRGRHKFLFRLEFDSKRLGVHKQFTRDYLGDVEVDQDLALTPFVTVKAGEITQCVPLKKSDPIPDRTAP